MACVSAVAAHVGALVAEGVALAAQGVVLVAQVENPVGLGGSVCGSS